MSAPVLFLVDKFKGSLTQSQINGVLGRFFQERGIQFTAFEIADGGEGTVTALIHSGWQRIEISVRGPLDNEHPALVAFNQRDGIIALELAELCGIRWLNGLLEPERSSTRAIGEALLQIASLPWQEIWIGLGGSASSDGGLGILQALGIRALDKNGREILESGLGALRRTARLDTDPRERIAKLLHGRKVKIITDVASPLLGRFGAINTFGPQKGLSTMKRISGERAMAKWARLVGEDFGKLAGAGSAGGTGFLFLSLFNAEYRAGVQHFLDDPKISQEIKPGSLIVAGEGRIDRSSLAGKSVLPILRLAAEKGAKVLLICGSADPKVRAELASSYPIVETLALADIGLDTRLLMERAEQLLYDRLVNSFRREWIQL